MLDYQSGAALRRRPPGFLALLRWQPKAYRVHQAWIETSSPEAVRRAMLEVRRWNEGTPADFSRRLEAAQGA